MKKEEEEVRRGKEEGEEKGRGGKSVPRSRLVFGIEYPCGRRGDEKRVGQERQRERERGRGRERESGRKTIVDHLSSSCRGGRSVRGGR